MEKIRLVVRPLASDGSPALASYRPLERTMLATRDALTVFTLEVTKRRKPKKPKTRRRYI